MKNRRQNRKWIFVESAAVRAVRYDSPTHELDVWFKEGRQYRYSDVPRSKYNALFAAPSIGAFVNIEIKPFHKFAEITSDRVKQRLDFVGTKKDLLRN